MDNSVTLHDVYLLALKISGDAAKAQAWLDHPMGLDRRHSPRQLVDGRGCAVIKYLHQIESGSSG